MASKKTAVASSFINRVPNLGIYAWSIVGFVIASIFLFIGLSAISEIILPMTFAAVLAVVFKPLATKMQKHKFKPSLAAGLIVLGLLFLGLVVFTATVRGVTDQMDEISAKTTTAIQNVVEQTDELGVDQANLDAVRAEINEAEPLVSTGFVAKIIEGIGSFIALAGGIILGSLIMYYFLKDGTSLRRSAVDQFAKDFQREVNDFIGDACRILRDYGRGRTIMSAIIALVVGLGAFLLGLPLIFTIIVVNFIGGYIPYIGAFLGGGLAVIIALGEGGLTKAAIMLAIVLVSNLALENFVEPKVMGRTLDIHPLVVLIVTALGGLLGGIVGLILAVPAYVIAGNAIGRLRNRGVVGRVSKQVRPTVKHMLN